MAVFCHLSFTFFLWSLPLGESQHAVFDDKNWKQPLSCPQNTYRWPCAGFLKAGSGLERERGASPQRISKTIIAVVFFGWLSSFSKWDFWKLCCFGTIPYIVHMRGGWGAFFFLPSWPLTKRIVSGEFCVGVMMMHDRIPWNSLLFLLHWIPVVLLCTSLPHGCTP